MLFNRWSVASGEAGNSTPSNSCARLEDRRQEHDRRIVRFLRHLADRRNEQPGRSECPADQRTGAWEVQSE